MIEVFQDYLQEAQEEERKKEALIAAFAEGEEEGVSIFNALSQIFMGTILVTLFSDALVDNIDALGVQTGIPDFVIGFVVCPMASNASELISSLHFAASKTKRTATVTYAQIYAACTMNNCMCLGIFFFMIWYKHLSWDYASEVLSILVVTWIMALISCNDTTIKVWHGVFAIFLYPLSLALVEVLKLNFNVQ